MPAGPALWEASFLPLGNPQHLFKTSPGVRAYLFSWVYPEIHFDLKLEWPLQSGGWWWDRGSTSIRALVSHDKWVTASPTQQHPYLPTHFKPKRQLVRVCVCVEDTQFDTVKLLVLMESIFFLRERLQRGFCRLSVKQNDAQREKEKTGDSWELELMKWEACPHMLLTPKHTQTGMLSMTGTPPSSFRPNNWPSTNLWERMEWFRVFKILSNWKICYCKKMHVTPCRYQRARSSSQTTF